MPKEPVVLGSFARIARPAAVSSLGLGVSRQKELDIRVA
jgi:hypothetical protein